MGKILDLARPRMAALWHLDITPGVDAVFEEISASYTGPVTVTQDLTVFNITRDAVTARQAKVSDAAPPVHGPSQTSWSLSCVAPFWHGRTHGCYRSRLHSSVSSRTVRSHALRLLESARLSRLKPSLVTAMASADL